MTYFLIRIKIYGKYSHSEKEREREIRREKVEDEERNRRKNSKREKKEKERRFFTWNENQKFLQCFQRGFFHSQPRS